MSVLSPQSYGKARITGEVSDGGWGRQKELGIQDSEKRLRGPSGETSDSTAGGLGAGLISKEHKTIWERQAQSETSIKSPFCARGRAAQRRMSTEPLGKVVKDAKKKLTG